MTSRSGRARPRVGRIATLAVSLGVTVVAALGAFGVLAGGSPATGAGAARPAAYLAPKTTASQPASSGATAPPTTANATTADASMAGSTTTGSTTAGSATTGSATTGSATTQPDPATQTALPARSGTGRRVVFSLSRQRVWLVGAQADAVERTYLVSGSVTHNLQPGTYHVYARSRHAVGSDGPVQYFVQFTAGPTGTPIGFQTIPATSGVPLETASELGTPRSHGCIRQATPDAIALWGFAPVHAKVVVVS